MKSEQESKSLTQKRFGQFAEGYVASQSHAKGYDLDQMVRIANPQPDWLVLDVATGGGHTALKFAPRVQKVIATDLTPEMLAAAQKFVRGQGITNMEFKPADAENLPFEAEMFDLVTCRIAPHHFPDCVRFIQEGSRVLKAGGILLVQDHLLPEDQTTGRYVDDFERLRDPSHHRAFSQSQWVQMFEQAGLEVWHTEEVIKRHQLLPWATRQDCSSETIVQLTQMLKEAPDRAAQWLQAEHLDMSEASFVNHHILIAGRK